MKKTIKKEPALSEQIHDAFEWGREFMSQYGYSCMVAGHAFDKLVLQCGISGTYPTFCIMAKSFPSQEYTLIHDMDTLKRSFGDYVRQNKNTMYVTHDDLVAWLSDNWDITLV